MLDVWEGDRKLTPRVVLAQQTVAARGLHFRYATEHIQAETDWCCFDESRHLIYVHRQGNLSSMKTVLDWGPTGSGTPRVGDVWVVPAGERCASLVQGSDPAGYCEIAIPVQAVGGEALIPRVKTRDPLLYQLTERLFSVAERGDAMARLFKDSLVEALRMHLLDVCTANPPRPAARAAGRARRDTLSPAVRSALVEFLHDGLDSEITLEVLADLAGMPVGRFIKAFSNAFNATPYQYLLDRRIDRAKSLLLTTSLTVTEISAAVGFSTPNHFATAFKKRVGVAPSGYRRQG